MHERQLALESARTDPRYQALPRPLVAIGAIAQDIGKLLAYAKSGSGGPYTKSGWLHSRAGAHILLNLPSFQALPPEDRQDLLYAVKYHHDLEQVPEDLPGRARALIDLLGASDHAAAGAARSRLSPEATTPTSTPRARLREAILSTAKNWNINGHRNSREPMGHVRDRIGCILEHHLREMVFAALSDEDARHFNHRVRRQGGEIHPGLVPILDELRSLGWLKENARDLGPAPLWDVKVAIKTWKACVLLEISTIPPDILSCWGQSRWQDIRVLRVHGDEPPEAEPPAEAAAPAPPATPRAVPAPAPTTAVPAPPPAPPPDPPAAKAEARPAAPPPLPPPPPLAEVKPLPPPPAAMAIDDGELPPREADPPEPPSEPPLPPVNPEDPVAVATEHLAAAQGLEPFAARTQLLERSLRRAFEKQAPGHLEPGPIQPADVPDLVNDLARRSGESAKGLIVSLLRRGAEEYLASLQPPPPAVPHEEAA